MIRNNKAITMVSLIITIAVMMIIAGATITISFDRFEINNLNKMLADIELLDDKVLNYYTKYNGIPVIRVIEGENENIKKYEGEISFTTNIGDNDTYYIIDLKAMEGIALNYGKGYEFYKAEDPDPNADPEDVYIINEESHSIYYIKGIEVDGKTYHSNFDHYVVSDNIVPTSPEIRVVSGEKNAAGVYFTYLELEMIPGKDNWSGIQETTYSINGGEELNITSLENNILQLNADGIYSIQIKTVDKRGNGSKRIYEFKIDISTVNIEPLNPEIVITGDKNAEGIYTKEVYLEMIPGKDQGGGVSITTYSINGGEEIDIRNLVNNILTITENGTYSVKIKSYNNYDKSSETEYEFTRTTQPPSKPKVEIISGEKDASGNYYTDIQLKVIPGEDKGSGVKKTTYSLDGGEETDITNLNILKIIGRGHHIIKIKSYNNYGESSEEENFEFTRITLPPLPPEILITGDQNAEGIYTKEVYLAMIPGKDNGSGVSKTICSINGGEEIDITTLAGNVLKITEDGTYNIIIKSYNDYGESSQEEYNFTRQTMPPSSPEIKVISGDKDTAGTYYTAIELQMIPGVDNGSGVSRTTYSINGGTEIDIATLADNILKITEDGSYKIKIKSYNNYGNSSEKKYEFDIKKIDIITPTQSYIGCYADIDDNGTVDGIIYADLAHSKSGAWWSSMSSKTSFEYSAKESLNNYYISKEKYKVNDVFGEKPVIAPIGTVEEKDRFYVMALNDITSNGNSLFYFYYSAYDNKMTDYNSITSKSFGSGKINTKNLLERWKVNYYGNKVEGDLWYYIENEINSGWFIPSIAEMSAFGYNFGGQDSNIKKFLDFDTTSYWSSSLMDKTWVYALCDASVSYWLPKQEMEVRLSTTF